jgi:hypothetical protein
MFSLRCLPGRRPLRRVQGLRDHEGRTAEYLRAQILEAFGFRPATAGEAEDLAEALLGEAAPYEYDAERLKGAACTRLRALKIEPGCRVLHSIALLVVSEWCQKVVDYVAAGSFALDALCALENQQNPGSDSLGMPCNAASPLVSMESTNFGQGKLHPPQTVQRLPSPVMPYPRKGLGTCFVLARYQAVHTEAFMARK